MGALVGGGASEARMSWFSGESVRLAEAGGAPPDAAALPLLKLPLQSAAALPATPPAMLLLPPGAGGRTMEVRRSAVLMVPRMVPNRNA